MAQAILAEGKVVVTEKEVNVVQMLANGERAKGIGQEVERSNRTIEQQVRKLKRKCGVKTTCELVAFFFRNNLIQ